MNVVEIIDENLKVLRTFSPDHKNVIDVSQPSMRLKWNLNIPPFRRSSIPAYQHSSIPCLSTREFKQATFLSRGRIPEVSCFPF